MVNHLRPIEPPLTLISQAEMRYIGSQLELINSYRTDRIMKPIKISTLLAGQAEDLRERWIHHLSKHRPNISVRWAGLVDKLEAKANLLVIVEKRSHEFLTAVPGWKPKKQNLEKFKAKMKSFILDTHGKQELALVAVKMLSVVINKPIALAIAMPGLPFHQNCGPFLIASQTVLDALNACVDPLMLMYEPITRMWTIFERKRQLKCVKRKAKLKNRASKRARCGNILGRRDNSSEKTIKKYNISPNYFAFKQSFRQLLLWIIINNEEWPCIKRSATREPVRFPISMDMKSSSRASKETSSRSLIHTAFDYVYAQGGQMKGLRGRSAREFGSMMSKHVKRSRNRKFIIEQAIKDNQIWNAKFNIAKKNGNILIGFSCSCDQPLGSKTISEKFSFCAKCDTFYGRTSFPVYKYQ